MAQIYALHTDGGLALFEHNGLGVVLNTSKMDVFDPVPMSTFFGKAEWQPVQHGYKSPDVWLELANAAVARLDVDSFSAGGSRSTGAARTFRIPKGVQQSAQRALNRLGDKAHPLGAKLAAGDCITLEEARGVQEFLASTKDTNDYALFGGSTGFRWSTNLIEKNDGALAGAGDMPSDTPPADDAEWIDPEQPHEFVEFADDPTLCAICQRPLADEIHVPAEVPVETPIAPAEDKAGTSQVFAKKDDEPADADTATPEDSETPHPFTPDKDKPEMCALCARDEGDPIHDLVEKPITASSFAYDESCSYFGVKESEDTASTTVVALLMKRPDDTWSERRGNEWAAVEAPGPDVLVIELDEEAATKLASVFDDTDETSVELSAISPQDEWEMFLAADSGIDWEAVDRVFDVYDPMERSVNAKRQTRDTGGRFGGGNGGGAAPAGGGGAAPGTPNSGDGPEIEVPKPPPKARLSSSLPIVIDVKALIDEYVAKAVAERAKKTSTGDMPPSPDETKFAAEAAEDELPLPEGEAPASAATPETSDVRPLYLAIVDEADTQAVLDVIALVPGESATDLACYKRDNGSWVRDEATLRLLRSITPPPVVELDDATLENVLSQMDPASEAPAEEEGDIASDGAPIMASAAQLTRTTARVRQNLGNRGYARFDGSFPIMDVRDLQTAIRASAGDASVQKHIIKRSRALGRFDLIPAEWKGDVALGRVLTPLWGPNGEILSLQAAGVPGVADTPGDIKNVQRLQRYWSHGEGAAKIGWNTDGDWKRCVSQLSKYMGTRAKGYCTLRHKEATGSWPGQHPGSATLLEEFGLRTEEQYMAITAAAAEATQEIDGVAVPDNVNEVQAGAPFKIALVIPEGVPSGDGRQFATGSLTTRDMPIPLYWQISTDEGHTGSVVVGRIDTVERVENGLGNATGVFDSGPYGREAERLVREKMLRGISGDLDNFEAEVHEDEDESKVTSTSMIVKKGRLMAATLVGKPAFQECYIELADDSTPLEQEAPVSDGVYEEDRPMAAAAEHALAALAASAAPVAPPIDWFENPLLSKPTALSVTDEGRVYGHIASWDVDHIGMAFGTRPPKSRSNYAYFQTGLLKTEQGKDVRVGQLTLAGGHAPLQADANAAVKHYDDTASAVADVSAGEDQFGIWVAGALRPNVTADQVRALRASAPSGDWRPINGTLELVAVCQVNVPGFPITRTMVAGGQVTALVAAGASTLARLREEPMSVVEQRLAALETFEQRRLIKQRMELAARMAPVLSEHEATLSTKAAKAREAFASYFAIDAQMDELRERVFGLKVMPKFEEKKHPRADDGKFRKVFARLMESLEDVPDMDTKDAVNEIEKAAEQEEAGDSQAAEETAKAAKARLDDIADSAVDEAVAGPAREAARQIDEGLIEKVTDAATGPDDEIAFGDLPPEVQDLVNKAIDQFLQQPVQGAIGTLESRLREWATGDGFASAKEIAALIAQYLTEKVRPQ